MLSVKGITIQNPIFFTAQHVVFLLEVYTGASTNIITGRYELLRRLSEKNTLNIFGLHA